MGGLVAAAIVLLFWNEGRAVTTAASLKEGAAAVVEVAAEEVLQANDLKLIHLSGDASTDEIVQDPLFLVGGKVLRVRRKTEMFQWREERSTESQKNLGGSERETKTYVYETVWAEERIDSSKFKRPEGHTNPAPFALSSARFEAGNVKLGAFELPQSIISQMPGDEAMPVTEADLRRLPEDLRTGATIQGGAFYFGADPEQPRVGDVRVSFEVLKPGRFSVLGRQTGKTLEGFPTRAGEVIERVEPGVIEADAMFRNAEIDNVTTTWLLRAGGFALMAMGFGMMIGLISVVADVIPLLWDILEVGCAFAAIGCAAVGSLMTIAVAWFAVRPGLSGVLIGVAGLCLFLGRIYGARRRIKSAAV